MVADEDAVAIDVIGILQIAMHLAVKEPDNLVLREIACDDRSALETQRAET